MKKTNCMTFLIKKQVAEGIIQLADGGNHCGCRIFEDFEQFNCVNEVV